MMLYHKRSEKCMVTVLDKPERVKEVDRSDMLSDLAKTPNYCRDAIKRAKQVDVPEKVNPKNIVIVGMGGSAIGGEILHDWLRDTLPIPIEVCRDYTLPAYVNKDTLVFANSYSGNTEETLTAFLTAIHRKCTILAVTSGGQLEAFCKKLQLPHVIIPSGLQPRVAIPYMFFPLPVLMEKLGILSNTEDELEEAIAVLEKVSKANAPDVPTDNNRAKQLATELMGTIPVIYGFRQYTSIAHRLKAQFNENSKVPSKSDIFPELNHNETVGYEAPETLNKKHSVILIRDPQEPPEIRNRIETTTNLVFNRANKVTEITAEGKGKLAKMFSVLCTGDYASVYLAVLQNKDPTPVNIIVRVKSELAKKSGMKEQFEAELAKLK
ncbi:MAG: bifunctional phosphoglucose/phosphomannose isomerase [Candidatus Bathyarchaeum sp.]|nr:MAG: bifunctional phosphoglucose/phosphomannose isomerase [Candidatus Bathyarchaeum sp.]